RFRSMRRKTWSAATNTNKSNKNHPIVPIPAALSITCHSNPAKTSADAIFNGVTRNRFIAAVYFAWRFPYGYPFFLVGLYPSVDWPPSFHGKPLETPDSPSAFGHRSHALSPAALRNLSLR